MRLDLRDKMHYNFFIDLAKYAGMELDTLRDRLGQARNLKANMGLYAGGNIATGFYVDLDPKSLTFEKYLEYKPHAEIVREIFHIALMNNGSNVATLRECRRRGLYFPLFEPQIGVWMNSRSGLRFCKHHLDENGVIVGYRISRGLLSSMFTNPAYIGMPIRNGQILEEGDHPVIVDPALFMAVYEKQNSNQSKPRGKFREAEPHLLQGIIFSNCRNEEIRPLYHCTQRSASKSHSYLKCSCGDDEPDEGVCFYVQSRVIFEPVCEHVLQQVSFPEVASQVREILEKDYSQAKERAKSYRRERQRLQNEIDTIRYNYTRTRLTDEAARLMSEDLDSRLRELRILEAKEMEAYSHQSSVSEEELKFVADFLSDIHSQWNKVPQAFQSRLFQLILEKVIVHMDNEDFFVDIYWKTGPKETLWVERPLYCAPNRKKWSKEEDDLLRQYYPSSSARKMLELLPDRTWDTMRTRATKLGISRNLCEGLNWTEAEDEMVTAFAKDEMTYKQIRRALPYRRQVDITRRIEKLGFETPDTKRIYWCLVNTSENESCNPAQCGGCCPTP